MADYRMKRLSNPGVLRSIDRKNLSGFLTQYRDFFARRGLKLPEKSKGGRLNYDKLITILMTPDEETPHELLDALYLIDELSTPDAQAALINEFHARSGEMEIFVVSFPENLTLDNPSPADVALCMWLYDRNVVVRVHAEWAMPNATRFYYFRSSESELEFPDRIEEALSNLQTELGNWFESQKWGRSTEIFDFGGDVDRWFLVRHGQPYRRLEGWNGKSIVSIEYQPLIYDAIVFDGEHGLLKVKPCSHPGPEAELYRNLVGKHVFGDDRMFSEDQVFSLEPLKDYGQRSLGCGANEGLDSIRATGLIWHFQDVYGRVETWNSDNIFSSSTDLEGDVVETAALIEAEFNVVFSGETNPRPFRLQLPNIAKFSRNEDISLIERWLTEQRFMDNEAGNDNVATIL
ncbi:hypothetical protein CA54_60570 [Symmachiella macrocystis]|uniref:Uncharacterized protein n=1 Tax=Symmachiella macrocystis TaxID=2527985 RepID=A0A5C6AVW6_9PLAN|nr:hypothetical protein [Symmachiella macrocystis]TWU04175.1 hypothetical protein CA54_60570 [Symmachiella macrocystis]